MKILAIDYGTVRVGIAISFASLAQPWQILDNDKQLIQNILKLIQEQKIQQIVVGISENKMAELTENFVKILKESIDLPLFFIDETLSSYQVHQFLKNSPAKKRQGPIDHLAAAIILQNFLDDQRC